MVLGPLLLQLSALLGAAVVLGLLARRIHVPVTVVLAVVAFGWNAITGGRWELGLRGEIFEEVLLLVFLPALVFAAVLGMSVRAFLRNLGAILGLAVVAMTLSALLVGWALHLGLGMPVLSAFVFGAVISATDPVAVVAVFREVGVPRRLLTLVEGESLMNDGAAIVLVSVLVGVAMGAEVNLGQGMARFASVFGGGVLIGGLLGLLVAALLPWLDRFSAVALSVALAYGAFVLAEEVLGFSGVMATVAAAMVVHGLAPSRASEELRSTLEQFWEAVDFIANAILFLLIGLVIEPSVLLDDLGPILVALIIALVARGLAVYPVVTALERLHIIPRIGLRNEAVLIWGGLRGGVALALALSLPEELAERDSIIALTGGVVLASLLLNATTISPLVRRLGLDQPDRFERFLSASARLSGAAVALRRLEELDLDQPEVRAHLEGVEADARSELEAIDLEPDDEVKVITGRGLAIERQTYQQLSDRGLLPPTVTRKLLHEVDDQIEAVQLGQAMLERSERPQPWVDRAVYRLVSLLPEPAGEDAEDLDYAEASARRLAARRTGEELELFARLPNVNPSTIERARATFSGWEERAVDELDQFSEDDGRDRAALRRKEAEALSAAAAVEALEELAEIGLLPTSLAQRAAAQIKDS